MLESKNLIEDLLKQIEIEILFSSYSLRDKLSGFFLCLFFS